jgi:hypothetical protein
MSNPFYYGGRVEPDQFVGRQSELRRIFTALEIAHTGQMQSVSVVGPRRIGKSSLLWYVTQRYSAFLQDAATYRFVYLDLQDARCHTLEGLLGQMTTQLGIRGKIGQLSLVTFQDAIIALRQQGILPVICLDEFEELVERQTAFPVDVYDSWRSLMNRHALAFITASKAPLPDLAQAGKYTSAFFNVFTSIPLGEFNDSEARQLIARGAHCDHPFTPREQENLLRLAGRYPYKLQLAGSLLYLAKAQGGPVSWSHLRRDFYYQCEQAGLATPWRKTIGARLAAAISWLVVTPATWLGRAMLEGVLRLKKDDVSQSTVWMFGAGLLIVMIALLFGSITINLDEILKLIERIRGNP